MKLSNKLRRIIYLSSTLLAAGGLFGVTTGLANADSTTDHQNVNPANTTKVVQNNVNTKTTLTSVASTSNDNMADTSSKPTLGSSNTSASSLTSSNSNVSNVASQRVSNTLNKITSNSVQNTTQSVSSNDISNSNNNMSSASNSSSSNSSSVAINPSLDGATPSFIMNGTDFTAIHDRTPGYIWNEFYHPLSSLERKSKEFVAFRESSGSYKARNGYRYGRFQFMPSQLHYNYSKTNQERTADRYVANRYGNWYRAALHEYEDYWY